MRKLLTVLFIIAAVIISCKSPTGANPHREKVGQIGSWMLYSDNSARCCSEKKAKIGLPQISDDTLHINAHGLTGLTIYQNNPGQLTYFDSTAWSWQRQTMPTVSFDTSQDMFHVRQLLLGYNPNDTSFVTFSAQVTRLKNQGTEPSHYFVDFNDSTHHKVYDFNITGMDSTYKSFNY